MWRTFHSDENSETIDSYVTCIRQMTTLLGYEEPQILDVFKNTLPSRLYWVLFQIEDLRQAVETMKRILSKERIGRQLAGQSTSIPFMSIWEGYSKNKRSLSFDTQNILHNKTDQLISILNKLSTQGSNQNRPFKAKIYQGRKRGQGRNNYYNICRQWVRFRSSSSDRHKRSNYRDRPQYGQNYREKSQYGQNYKGGKLRKGNKRGAKNYGEQTFRREYIGNYGNSNFDRGRSRSMFR